MSKNDKTIVLCRFCNKKKNKLNDVHYPQLPITAQVQQQTVYNN